MLAKSSGLLFVGGFPNAFSEIKLNAELRQLNNKIIDQFADSFLVLQLGIVCILELRRVDQRLDNCELLEKMILLWNVRNVDEFLATF